MAGTFGENVPLLANDSARGTHLLRKSFLHINNYRLPKNILTAGWKFSLRQQTSYLLEPLLKLNYAPRIWQKCSIIKLTILEMGKMAIF
jgi:hypothetical protein